jgi:hypothetical protein
VVEAFHAARRARWRCPSELVSDPVILQSPLNFNGEDFNSARTRSPCTHAGSPNAITTYSSTRCSPSPWSCIEVSSLSKRAWAATLRTRAPSSEGRMALMSRRPTKLDLCGRICKSYGRIDMSRRWIQRKSSTQTFMA